MVTRFKPGESGNRAGRPVGAKKKITPVSPEELQYFLNEHWEDMKRNFKKLTPAEQAQFYAAVLQAKFNNLTGL